MKVLENHFFVLMSVLLFAMYFQGCCNAYKGPPSDHYDGSRFFNSEPDHTFMDMVKWLWEMETVPWPEWIEDPEQPPPVENVGKGVLRVTFINQATVLIQMDGLNILTDPIWSFRASPVSWAGPKRVRAPGVSMNDLPKIHYVLISHDHHDHLDLDSLKKIVKRHRPTILVGLGVKELLSGKGLERVEEMDWWEEHRPDIAEIRFTFVPARHNSGRWPFMKNKTLWGGFVIESPSGQVYFAGDTAYGGSLSSISERFNRIRLSILPIGSYEKRWFMKSQHMNPHDAVRAHKLIKAHQSIGVHFGTFAEHPEQAIDTHEKDLSDALEKYNVPPSRFWILQFGEGRDVSSIPALSRDMANSATRRNQHDITGSLPDPLISRLSPKVLDGGLSMINLNENPNLRGGKNLSIE